MNKSDVQPTSIGPYKSWWSKVGCKKWARTRAGRPGHRARQIYCWGLLDRGVLPLVVVLADAPDGPGTPWCIELYTRLLIEGNGTTYNLCLMQSHPSDANRNACANRKTIITRTGS